MSAEPVWMPDDRRPENHLEPRGIRSWLGLEAADEDAPEEAQTLLIPEQTPSVGWVVLQDLRSRRDLV